MVLEWKGSGSKLSFTKVQPVNSAGMVVFDETLNMVRPVRPLSDQLDADDGHHSTSEVFRVADNYSLPNRNRVRSQTVHNAGNGGPGGQKHGQIIRQD